MISKIIKTNLVFRNEENLGAIWVTLSSISFCHLLEAAKRTLSMLANNPVGDSESIKPYEINKQVAGIEKFL